VKIILSFIFNCLVIIAFTQQSYNIESLDHWTDTTLIKGAEDAIFSDLWGFKINEKNYVALGSTEGTHIFNITNNTLKLIDFKSGKFSSNQVQHRDYKTYKNYLYAVCDEGSSSLQIFDLSFLPDSIHKVYDSATYFQICHNIYIDTLNAKLYAAGPNNIGLKVFDISNPVEPVLFSEITTINYIHDCFVKNNIAYLNCGFEGLQIYNFETNSPQQIGLLDFYVDQGYNHSGWLSEDGSKYIFIDETQGKKIKICNSKSIESIEIESLYGTKNYQDYVPHNVQIYNNYAFISYYNEGLRVVDISTSKPKEVAFFDSFTQSTNYKLNGAWGVFVFKKEELILISDRQNGLFLLHFPIQLFRQENTSTSNTPFINEQSKIIFHSNQNKNLSFSIFNINGQIVYQKEAIKDWINIPLTLKPNAYIYKINNQFGDEVTRGKFIIAN